MTENPVRTDGPDNPAPSPPSVEELRRGIEAAGDTPVSYLLAERTVPADGIFNGAESVASLLGPTNENDEQARVRREQELALMRSVLGSNARYLSTPLRAIENVLGHPAGGGSNRFTRTGYTMTLDLGTVIEGGSFRFVASPADSSSFGNAKKLHVTSHLRNK